MRFRRGVNSHICIRLQSFGKGLFSFLTFLSLSQKQILNQALVLVTVKRSFILVISVGLTVCALGCLTAIEVNKQEHQTNLKRSSFHLIFSLTEREGRLSSCTAVITSQPHKEVMPTVLHLPYPHRLFLVFDLETKG